MLRKIFTPDFCAQCRVCCNFSRASVWETPSLGEDEARELRARGAPLVRRGDAAWTVRLDFEDEGENANCPMLDPRRGCALEPERRPFECRIWPLRLMRDGAGRVFVACYRNCPALAGENWRRLVEFVNGELTDVLAERARSHPENVRPFNPAYAEIAEVAAGPRT